MKWKGVYVKVWKVRGREAGGGGRGGVVDLTESASAVVVDV